MFGGLCGPMGLAGWVVLAVIWTGVIALVVWAITRLFPERPASAPPPAGTGSVPDVTTTGGRR